MLRARVDRHRCVAAGNCISIAPTAFDWHAGEAFKADVIDVDSVEDELLREAALSCPTQAIVIEEFDELLPWQLRGKGAPRRVEKTFMFTDIVKSTNLIEAMGDEAWESLKRWHDEALRSLFAAHRGDEVAATQVGQNFTGKGVHAASRIAGLAEGGEILASRETAADGRFTVSEVRTVDIRGMAEPIEVVSVDWR
jgi:class 3 adenylate cyclase